MPPGASKPPRLHWRLMCRAMVKASPCTAETATTGWMGEAGTTTCSAARTTTSFRAARAMTASKEARGSTSSTAATATATTPSTAATVTTCGRGKPTMTSLSHLWGSPLSGPSPAGPAERTRAPGPGATRDAPHLPRIDPYIEPHEVAEPGGAGHRPHRPLDPDPLAPQEEREVEPPREFRRLHSSSPREAGANETIYEILPGGSRPCPPDVGIPAPRPPARRRAGYSSRIERHRLTASGSSR